MYVSKSISHSHRASERVSERERAREQPHANSPPKSLRCKYEKHENRLRQESAVWFLWLRTCNLPQSVYLAKCVCAPSVCVCVLALPVCACLALCVFGLRLDQQRVASVASVRAEFSSSSQRVGGRAANAHVARAATTKIQKKKKHYLNWRKKRRRNFWGKKVKETRQKQSVISDKKRKQKPSEESKGKQATSVSKGVWQV